MKGNPVPEVLKGETSAIFHMWLKPVIADENRVFKGRVSFTPQPCSVDLWSGAGVLCAAEEFLVFSRDVTGLKHRRDFFLPLLQNRNNYAPL